MTATARRPQTIDAASGETLDCLVTVTEDGESSGTVVDLTDFTAKFVMVDASGTVVASTEVSPATVSIDWPDRVNGQVKWTVDPDVTDPLVGTYKFELQLTDGNGKIRRAAFGYVNLPPNLIAA